MTGYNLIYIYAFLFLWLKSLKAAFKDWFVFFLNTIFKWYVLMFIFCWLSVPGSEAIPFLY